MPPLPTPRPLVDSDTLRTFLWLCLVLSAPWALVLIVCLVRGYTISVHLVRKRDQDRREG